MLVGVATGFGQFVQLNVPGGDHKYVVPPLPLSVIELPNVIVASGPAFAIGEIKFVTVTVVVMLHDVCDGVGVHMHCVGMHMRARGRINRLFLHSKHKSNRIANITYKPHDSQMHYV